MTLALENKWYIIWSSLTFSLLLLLLYMFSEGFWVAKLLHPMNWGNITSQTFRQRQCLLILSFDWILMRTQDWVEAFEFKWHQHLNFWLVKFLQFYEPKLLVNNVYCTFIHYRVAPLLCTLLSVMVTFLLWESWWTPTMAMCTRRQRCGVLQLYWFSGTHACRNS